MAREIFVDAGFWIALLHRRDERYAAAQTAWREVIRAGWPTCTTNWTLYETMTFFSCRLGRHDLAVGVLEIGSASSTVVGVEEAVLERRTLEVFGQHSDKRWSVVDCANFACIESRQCEFALAYDRNFEQAQLEFGFRVFEP